MKPERRVPLDAINLTLFFIGAVGVWFTTHNFSALLFTLVASLHFEIKVKDGKKK